MLQDYGVSHFEEPCPYWKPDWTREVSDALEIDVSGGEQDNDMRVWRHMIDTSVDIIQPDICYLGGITRTLEVAKMAEKKNIPVTLHAANLSLVTLFSAHIMGSIKNPGKYLEFSIEGLDYYPWQDNIFTPDFKIVKGSLEMSHSPAGELKLIGLAVLCSNIKSALLALASNIVQTYFYVLSALFFKTLKYCIICLFLICYGFRNR